MPKSEERITSKCLIRLVIICYRLDFDMADRSVMDLLGTKMLKASEAWIMKIASPQGKPAARRGRTALGGKCAWEFSLREHDLAMARDESFLVGGHT